ncbi:nephrin-like [Penaeus japonicus]|uniref:nephrin-like n=1 Tax=Penaeus japonicus TaxID=27405 RepID=UPI001C713AB6|nr:nephrin-like [Penaeus japonicus]
MRQPYHSGHWPNTARSTPGMGKHSYITLPALVAPSSVSIVGFEDGAVVEVVAGTSLTLECLVADARPAPEAVWYRGEAQVDPALQEDQVEASTQPRRWSVRSQLVVTAEPEDDGKRIKCQAIHTTLVGASEPFASSITLSVLHPPGDPVITGYEQGEVLRAGARRTLTCHVSGGKPRPWVLWYREGRLLDDNTTSTGPGTVVNSLEVAVTAGEDGAVYVCSVSNDLMQEPLTANVTFTVYYAPSSVTILGPSQAQDGANLALSCVTSTSNPPASLSWIVAGKVIDNARSIVMHEDEGGFVTTSNLTDYLVRSDGIMEITVECRAVNPAIDKVVRDVRTIDITRAAGVPVFEGDLKREYMAGSIVDLTCTSVGGHPPPAIRIYKGEEEIPTSLLLEANISRATAEIEVTPVDNGVKVTCEVSNPATLQPLTISKRLTILFPPWEVTGSAFPNTVEAGTMVNLTCESSSSVPPANLTWRSDGTRIEGAAVRRNQAAFGGTSTM